MLYFDTNIFGIATTLNNITQQTQEDFLKELTASNLKTNFDYIFTSTPFRWKQKRRHLNG